MSGNQDESWKSVRAPISEQAALQRPGGYETLRKIRFPDGVGRFQDRRLHLDLKMLRMLVEMAEGSPTQRAVIHGVVVDVEQLRTPNGHVFESWTFAGHPVGEGTQKDSTAMADLGQVRRTEGR